MKKIIFILSFIMLAGSLPSQVKVNFSLTNPRYNAGVFSYDLRAVVPAGHSPAGGAIV